MTEAKGRRATRGPKVGKWNPPPGSQWPPGVSGNLLGRPRGALGLMGQVRRQLGQPVQMKDGRTVQAAEAIARTMIEIACRGDLRAIQLLLSCSPDEAAPPAEPAASPGSGEDESSLIDDALLKRNMKNEREGQ